MKYISKMRNKLLLILFVLCSSVAKADSIAAGFARPLQWHVGAQFTGAYVPGTNGFLRGDYPDGKKINSSAGGDVRAGFSFARDTREGILYKDLYQGIGIGVNTFFDSKRLGTPVSAYVYQGAPIARFGSRLSLDYEWQFGAAFGWKHFDVDVDEDNAAVSTSVTAHIGLGFKLRYSLSDRLQLAVGVAGRHFSNGNTEWPNAGVNTVGLSVGLTYLINPDRQADAQTDGTLIADANRGRWVYDIIGYGAWRKRTVSVGDPAEAQMCPGRFAVAGLQFSPMRKLNRYVAVGPSLDLQWDQSACLEQYWLDGSYGDNIKFYRPPFGKQIGVGLSAHAELTMPIFAVNAGLGFNVVNPRGDKRFYQSLALKTFVSRHIFINVGYRLGNFKNPQNLMLGMGVRL